MEVAFIKINGRC